ANLSLTNLDCASNSLTNLYLSNNTLIKKVACNNNQLTNLDVSNNTSLVVLNAMNNNLSSLDLSNNVILEELYCGINSLSSIDVTNNALLETLKCHSNSLNALNVSSNSLLKILNCGDNLLKTLDVTNNSVLENLNCYGNSLISLNLANNNNFNLSYVESRNNQDLYCIQVDSGFSPYLWDKDSHADYSDVCESIISGGGHTTAGLSLFPNPANTIININYDIEIEHLALYSADGVKLLDTKSVKSLNLEGYKKGLYIIVIEDVEGNVVRQKFIKE
ncbi:T9SS type A sorting domain-containing protein, partial [Winogradskyella sp. 4-2091]|uniref:T9SS type A sorting domain-containing protein n=1 Tax=Winogradskyella sp. 4-2091 TaxID=3381659 RepID=UPI003892103F